MMKLIYVLVKDKEVRKWIPIFSVCSLLGLFIILTSEVRESLSGQIELIGEIDKLMLNYFINLRNPLLSSVAIDITALGSGAVITILVIFFSTFWFALNKKIMAIQLFVTAALASLLTFSLKFYFERSRPEAILRLIDVQGFSYPSGHSLFSSAIYFTIAMLLVGNNQNRFGQIILWSLFMSLISLIGLTRIYLGVHYFSDVIAGILLGIATATIVEIYMNLYKSRLNYEV